MSLAPHYWPKQVTRIGLIQGTWKQIHVLMGRQTKKFWPILMNLTKLTFIVVISQLNFYFAFVCEG